MRHRVIKSHINGPIIVKFLSPHSLSGLRTARWELSQRPYYPKSEEPPGVPSFPPKQPYAAPFHQVPKKLYTDDLFWDRNATHMEDIGSYLPLHTLKRIVRQNELGTVSQRYYSIPTDYSQRRSLVDALEILRWCHEDSVDGVFLVPL